MTTISFKNAGDLIKYQRKILRLNHQEFSQQVGISAMTLSKIERGVTNTSYETLKKIFKELGLGPVYITVVDPKDELLHKTTW